MKKTTLPCLRIVLPPSLAETVSWQLADLGASAVEQRDESTMNKVGGGFAELRAGFASAALRDRAAEALRHSGGDDAVIERLDVVDDGWSTRWREHFKPVVLDRLQVITPWMTAPSSDRITIVIDPGQAFGTGGHATTRLVLQMLEQRASKGPLPEEVLDVGTGSGILAVAAAKLGARQITALDVDDAALAAAAENAARNGVAGQVVLRDLPLDRLTGRWPLVLANLEFAIFQKTAAAIADRVSDNGALILSGLLVDQVSPCLALWPGFRLAHKRAEAGWAGLTLVRGPA